MSDTDSFLYAVYTEDAYADIYEMKAEVDLSKYRLDTVLGKFQDKSNEKIPGKFSDERPSEILLEVWAPKPKMYAVRTRKLICPLCINGVEGHIQDESCLKGVKITAKGVSKAAKRDISCQDFEEVLREGKRIRVQNRRFGSENYINYSILENKWGLSAFDDKKYILNDGIHTLSYGHKDIPKIE